MPPMKYVVRISVDSVWDMGPGAARWRGIRLAALVLTLRALQRATPRPGALALGAPLGVAEANRTGGNPATKRQRQ
jgi:hypothetical protein